VYSQKAFSTLAHETILHARLLNLKTVFTDHSLFGFADTSSILTNKLLEYTITNCDHVICVSHTSRENTVLRANMNDATKVSVIPNAVDSQLFKPEIKHADKSKSLLVSRSWVGFRMF
jgi:phosphatidylinositol glycan class A protein